MSTTVKPTYGTVLNGHGSRVHETTDGWLTCKLGADRRFGSGLLREVSGSVNCHICLRVIAARNTDVPAPVVSEEQYREQANGIALLADALAAGRIPTGQRRAAISRLRDQIDTLAAWTPDDRA